MKTSTLFGSFVTAFVMLLLSGSVSAQETKSVSESKKEIHIKIVSDGVVTKDTVYISTDGSSEFEDFEEMAMHHHGKHNVEKQVIIMNSDGSEETTNATIVQEGGEQKEVRVIVRDSQNDGNEPPVEEIWIGGPQDGRPCHTIIIHEGNCPGGEMDVKGREGNVHHHGGQIPPPPPPPPAGGSPVIIEKKVIKTDEGEKVIIVETNVDNQSKSKGKKKK
jgi:hypothetical protein